MNLRQKFIWEALLVLSFIVMVASGWFIYKMYTTTDDFWAVYNSETVGTDKALSEQIVTLENDFVERQEFKFRAKEIPTDLSRVIMMDDDALGRFYGGSSVRFSAGIAGKTNHAIAHYKDRIFHVTAGDSVAGGLVMKITPTDVTYSKEDIVRTFSLLPSIATDEK